MKRLSLLFLIFILFFHFYEGRHYFSYSQQLQKENDEARRVDGSATASEEEYLKYEGPNIAQAPNIFGASIRMITVLLVLLALFFSVIFFLKKFQQRRSIQEKGPISVLCRLSVGSKESILIVDIMDEIFVLGVTSAQISLLFKVEDADKLRSFQELQTSSTFQNYLKFERENIKVASELRSNELRSTVLESLRALREKLRKV